MSEVRIDARSESVVITIRDEAVAKEYAWMLLRAAHTSGGSVDLGFQQDGDELLAAIKLAWAGGDQ